MKLAWMAAVIGLSCGLAQAGTDASFVAGTWSGTGVFQVADRILPCTEVTMRFAASPTRYNLEGASLRCGPMVREEARHAAYDIHADGQIYFGDVPVGQVGEDRLHITNPVGAGAGMSDDYTLLRRGEVVVFTQVMGARDATPRFSFTAILKRAEAAVAP